MSRILILALFLLPACSSFKRGEPPSRTEQLSADYGVEPTDYKLRIQKATYDDGFTFGQFEVDTPKPTWYGHLGNLTTGRDVRYGFGIRMRGYRIGFTKKSEVAVERTYYFLDNKLDAVSEKNGKLRFYN